MINKQNLWFLTLFSIILVLSVYYIALPENGLTNLLQSNETKSDNVKPTISESDILIALRIESDEMVLSQMNSLQKVLLDEKTTPEEKNEAYEKLLSINLNKGQEAKLEAAVLKAHNLKTFIKIKDDVIKVVVSSNKGSFEEANKIIRTIQQEYDEKMYITVKYQ